MKDKQLLQSLKSQLSQFKTFDCNLKHEEIIDIEFTTGTDYLGNALEPTYKRIGFCSKAFRNNNISCAHTSAAIKFKKIIKEIISAEEFKGDESIISFIDELVSKIYLLDIEKSALEKQLAYLSFSNSLLTKSDEIRNQLSDIIKKHSIYIHQLELLRQSIINEIDKSSFNILHHK